VFVRRFFAFFLFFSCCTFAQTNGRLTGSVVDPSGAAVPKATVNLFLHGGKRPQLSTVTNNNGAFDIESIRPEVYDVEVQSAGFQLYRVENVKIDASRPTDLPSLKLALAAAASSVNVTAGAETVQTTSPTVSTTITAEQLEQLPVPDRNPLAFIYTQAGVGASQFATNINGQRESFSNVTLDGMNIQDNYLRDNDLDFTPNLLLLDQVKEVTVTTALSGAEASGGSQVNLVTPSGTNELHGALYYQNRNNDVAANDFFDNRDGTGLPRLNLNQAGGKVGGPIKRDKLFYYVNYEAYRLVSQQEADATILTQTARDGIFSYINANGQLQQANILQITGLPPDPAVQALINQIPPPSKINNNRVGDSQPGQLLNTAGYGYLVRDDEQADNVTGKIDYNLSTKHVLAGSYAWNRNYVDRPDVATTYSTVPPVSNNNDVKFATMSWRWSPTPNLTNEVRGGLNFAPATFNMNGPFPSSIIGNTDFTSPVAAAQFLPQGRNTRTRSIQDNGYWNHGKHTVEFGYQYQGVRIRSYDYGGTIPTYNVDINSSAQQHNLLGFGDLPGVGATDLQAANELLVTLAGLLDNDNAVYNVTSRTSGFVPGQPWVRNFTYDNHAFYGQDEYKIRKNLTLTAGLRWDYYTPVNEVNSLELQPALEGKNAYQSLLDPNNSLVFYGNSAGQPFYQKNLKNFAPNAGLAWDVFGDGKTSIRAGYALRYVDDQMVEVTDGFTATNPGLQAFPANFNLSGTVNNPPPIPVPPFQVPTSFATQYNLNSEVYYTLINPKLAQPYDQQFAFVVQRELKGTIIELRFIGDHATKLLRGFDLNQENISSNGFLSNFLLAQNNGFLALKKNGIFNPAYNASVPGSQPLPVFAHLTGDGELRNSTYDALIENGEAGELAYQYTLNGQNGSLGFFPNPNALSSVYLDNFSNSHYDSGQAEVRRRFQSGLSFQVNYVFSKWLSDGAGLDQQRFEPFEDINNTKLEESRTPTDLTDQFKANYSYALPIGGPHMLRLRGGWDRLLQGWSTSGILSWVSGNPISIDTQSLTAAGWGTFLREDFSAENMADTTRTKGQINGLLGVRRTGDGVYYIASSAIGPGGYGVAQAGAAPFSGQAFTNPGAGTLGQLQRRMFDGPPVFSMDAAVLKDTKINERLTAQLRVEALNVFNHTAFAVFSTEGTQFLNSNDNMAINSPQFGQITSLAVSPRRMQFGLRLSF
jgi:outer membrane receptor protein involved in Fe transport